MNAIRKTLLLISVGGGVKIPFLEGDEIKVCTHDQRTIYIWKPNNDTGKFVDLSRLKKGKNGFRHIHKRFFKALTTNGQITLIKPDTYRANYRKDESHEIQSSIPMVREPTNRSERLKPLLRPRNWGIPPRWC